MTNLPTSFSIDSSNKMYYNAKDMCECKPELFKGIKTKRREIIERNKIPSIEYIYACFNSKFNSWNVSDKECSKAQLLITKEWVDIHMFNIYPIVADIIASQIADIIAPIPQVAPIIPSQVADIIAPIPQVAPIIAPACFVENKKQSEEPQIKKKFKFRIRHKPVKRFGKDININL